MDERQIREDEGMTLVEHLEELRKRVVRIIVVSILAIGVSFVFASDLLAYIVEPVDSLVILTPGEGFFATLRLAIMMGLALASPFIIYQLVAFILPALTKQERKYLYVLLPFGYILFWAGVLFAYFAIVPYVYRFFIGFTYEGLMEPYISVSSYLGFVLGVIIPFGIIFELPILVSLLTLIGLVTPDILKKYRKYAILLVFVVAAFFTPPDPISQGLMAGPLILLYEFSIWISKIVYKRRLRREDFE